MIPERSAWNQRHAGAAGFRLTLLGGFGLAHRGRPIAVPVGAQRVLAFLALQPQRLLRAYVAGSLWPDRSQGRSVANLRSALWRLRRQGLPVVTSTSSHLSLAADLSVDTHEVTAMARRLMDPSAACLADDLEPQALAGELLPDWSTEDWLVVERERFRQLRLHGLEAMCMRLQALDRHGEAIEAGLAAVRGEPLRESAHRVLIAAHLAEGNHQEALRQYRWCERILRDELSIRPSPQTTRLVERTASRNGAMTTR
jgi:DNA-binding SARP family transcriptional activator